MNNIYKVVHLAGLAAFAALILALAPFFILTIPFAAVIHLVAISDFGDFKEQMLGYICAPYLLLADMFKEALE